MAQSGALTATIKNGDLWQTEDAAPVPWWSFTKTCLAAASLVLVARGQLKLDELLDGKPYTLRQLLQHRAGVPDYYAVPAYHEAVERMDEPWLADELLERSRADQLIYPPGEGWAYSNIGYYFVRRILEGATGNDLGAVFDEFLFTPLDIAGIRLARETSDLADIAWSEGKDYRPNWVYHGLLVGTPAQAVRVLHGLMTSDLLPSMLLEEMKAPHLLNVPTEGRPWQKPGYGLGLMIDSTSARGAVYGHTGQGPGSTAAVYHFADLDPVQTVAVFQQTMNQGEVEFQAVALAG